jgi:hypothetical protein
MEILRWEDPAPKPTGAAKRVHEAAVELSKNMNRWAVIGLYKEKQQAAVRASQIRRGHVKMFTHVGKFETDYRPTPDGWAVYARCVALDPVYESKVKFLESEAEREKVR